MLSWHRAEVCRAAWTRLAAACALALLGAPAAAQLVVPDPYRPNDPVGQILEDAKARCRLAVVIVLDDSDEDTKIAASLAESPSLSAWFLWHAEVRLVRPDENPAVHAEWERMVRLGASQGADIQRSPYAIVFLPGGRAPKIIPDPGLSKFRYERDPISGRPRRRSLSPLELLLQGDILMERLAALEPVWLEWHERRNPPPPPPALRLFADAADGLGAPITDADVSTNPLDALLDARRSRDGGYRYDATGLYTWLWENLERQDPALRPVRLFCVAPEFGALAARDDGARERLDSVRSALGERLLWLQWDEWLAWMASSSSEDDVMGVVDALWRLSADEYEESILPVEQEAAFNSLIRAADRWADPWKVHGDEREYVRGLASAIARRAPDRCTPEDWDAVRTLRREILLAETARGHVAMLKQGDEAGAMELATIGMQALSGLPEGLAGMDAGAIEQRVIRSILWTAAAEGQTRGIHDAWIASQPEVLRSMFRNAGKGAGE